MLGTRRGKHRVQNDKEEACRRKQSIRGVTVRRAPAACACPFGAFQCAQWALTVCPAAFRQEILCLCSQVLVQHGKHRRPWDNQNHHKPQAVTLFAYASTRSWAARAGDNGILRPVVFYDVVLGHFEVRQLAMVVIANDSRKSGTSEVGMEIAQEVNGASRNCAARSWEDFTLQVQHP